MNDAAGLAREWTAFLGTVLESLSGEKIQLTCAPAAPEATLDGLCRQAAAEHGPFWWCAQEFPSSGRLTLWIGAPQAAWSQLAGRVLGAAGVDEDTQARETYLEIVQQSCGELARSLARQWGRPVKAAAREVPEPPSEGQIFQVAGSYPDQPLAPLLLVLTGSAEPALAEDQPAPAVACAAIAPAAQPSSRNFDLLMNVELPVSVSFGHVQLPLKDVLKLAAGSIIELNRTVDEPVEVIVNNCVVARGEVVVVEGNYGVRIHQILSRQERLENLP